MTRKLLLIVGFIVAIPAVAAGQPQTTLGALGSANSVGNSQPIQSPSVLPQVSEPAYKGPGSKTVDSRKAEALSVAGIKLGDSEETVTGRISSGFPAFETIKWERRIKGLKPDLGVMAYQPDKTLVVATESHEYVRVSFHHGKAWYIEYKRDVTPKEAEDLRAKLSEVYGEPSWRVSALDGKSSPGLGAGFTYKWLFDAKRRQYERDDGSVSGCSEYTTLNGYTIKARPRCGAALLASAQPKANGAQYNLRLYDNRVQMARLKAGKAK